MNCHNNIGHNIAESYIRASESRDIEAFMALLAPDAVIIRTVNGKLSHQLLHQWSIRRAFANINTAFTDLERKIIDRGLQPHILRRSILENNGQRELHELDTTLYIEENILGTASPSKPSESKKKTVEYEITKVVTLVKTTLLPKLNANSTSINP